MPQLQPLRKHVARKRRPGESRLMTLQAPPWRTGPEAVTRGKTNHFLIQSRAERVCLEDTMSVSGCPPSIGARRLGGQCPD